MGKSRKKLAVLLAAAMTLSMTFGMTAFAADDTVPVNLSQPLKPPTRSLESRNR